MREVVLVAVAATVGNLLIGWDSSTIAGGVIYIKKEFHLESDPTLEGLIVSMSFLAGTFVSIFSGSVSDMLGRRPLLIISSVSYFLSAVIMLWAPNVIVILLSRMLDGAAIALAVSLTPLYISEIAPPDIRGQLTTLTQFSNSGGMFVAYCIVFGMSLMDSPSWRMMFGILSIPSVIYFLVTVFYLPESPRWLVSKGRVQEAKKILERLRDAEDVSGELALLAEGLSPGDEDARLEEYIVAPASDLPVSQEAGKEYIKLYGLNEDVSMIAQPVTGHGSRTITPSMSQGSFTSQGGTGLKDPIVSLFESVHENMSHSETGSRGMSKVFSVSSMGDHHEGDAVPSPYGTSDSLGLHSPLLSTHGTTDKDMRSNSSLLHGNAGEIASKTNIGGGWQLVYKSGKGASGRREGELQRVYLHAEAPVAVASSRNSFVLTSGHEIHVEGEAFPAAAIVSRSVLSTQDMLMQPEVPPKGTNWKTLLEPGVKRALIVGVGLQILQQAAGINGFLYYAPQILQDAGVGDVLTSLGISSTSASLLVNAITTFCMLPCMAVSLRLMDVLGRRSMMLYTVPILIVCLLILVLRNFFDLNSALDATITAICVIIYESVFCMGLGVIPNIICSEIFPTTVRGICISMCILAYWVSTLIVTYAFPSLLELVGLTGVFGIFVVGCIITWIFVYWKVPETKGMPLEVIIEFFAIGARPGTDPATLGMKN